MRDPLLDEQFLLALDNQYHRTVGIKIVALDLDENPIEELSGKIRKGTINIDGKSAVRRTCSLSMVANYSNGENFKMHEYYWGLNQKIQLYIGLKNNIDKNYPEMIWFSQGIFFLTSFKTSQGMKEYEISLQGKDKMALLNGDLGGNITSLSVDFGTQDYIDAQGVISNKKMLLKDIITEVVHEYAREPYHNIIVSDLDDVGLELMEYRGQNPLYLIVDENTSEIDSMVFGGSGDNFLYNINNEQVDITNLNEKEYNSRIRLDEESHFPTFLYSQSDTNKSSPKTVIKCNYGDVVGYKITDLTYAGDLIGQTGNTVISACLDKIVKMLGDYEYFYNLDGKFVFQRKKTYINTSFNNFRSADSEFQAVSITEDEFLSGKYYVRNAPERTTESNNFSLNILENNVYNLYSSQFLLADVYNPSAQYYQRIYLDGFYNDSVETSSIQYSFLNSTLVTSFSNTPDFNNIKNDFSIWGQRKSVDSGKGIPIHLRYAIDKKPNYYKNFEGNVFISKDSGFSLEGVERYYDWRELIYQMALDKSLYGHRDDFLVSVRKNNIDYYPTGYTGYEQYYTDVLSFWRQLYYPDYPGEYEVTYCREADFLENKSDFYWYKRCEEDSVFSEEEDYYILDLRDGYILKSGLKKEFFDLNPTNYYVMVQCDGNSTFDSEKTYFVLSENQQYNESGWNVNINQSPELLNFWFDFLDTDGELRKYSCYLIGNRPKAIKDDNIQSLFTKETPTIIFVENSLSDEEYEEQRTLKPGYTFFRVSPELKELFTISGQGQTAKDKLEELLYENAYCSETVNFITLPVYYLEPNARIFIRDDITGINNEYIVSKISYSFGKAQTHNGTETMNVTAVKAVDRIY